MQRKHFTTYVLLTSWTIAFGGCILGANPAGAQQPEASRSSSVGGNANNTAVGTPPPPGVVEIVGLEFHSLVELKDGSLLANNGQRSTDGGLTWSEPRSFGEGIEGIGLIRLQSGRLALTGNTICFSEDEGKTWGQSVEIFPKVVAGDGTVLFQVHEYGDSMIQLSSGRLIYAPYISYNGDHPAFLYEDASSYGTWRGQRYQVEGHGHYPEIYVSIVTYSDDEGKTWKIAKGNQGRKNALMGWFDAEGNVTGHRGVTGFGETTAAETADGRVLLFGRPLVNRVVYTTSSDGGETWSAVQPTQLANSISPPRLRRIPLTGDLLCIWNQVSREEIQRGYRRGRLSSAISKDGGASWENFKTIEVSEGLEDIDRIAPEYPIKMVRARDDVGPLPDGWSYFHYSNVRFVGDKVFLKYPRGGPRLGVAEQNLKKQDQILRIYPLDWFYQ